MSDTTSQFDSITTDILDATQVAAIIKLHPVTVRLKAAAGEIPGRQIGNRWRFSRQRIIEWLGSAGQEEKKE
jgi:excisionase family DNA binding protein